MFAALQSLKSESITGRIIGAWLAVPLLLGAAGFARTSLANPAGPVDWSGVPLPACPADRGGGDGHSPDPLVVFNQHVEMADGEIYLIRGTVVLSARPQGGDRTHKLQPYFNVDLDAHPWLGGRKRRESPYYLIEGGAAYWRAYSGSYGELAAIAHVQFKTDAEGTIRQVISLKVIPELSMIPRRE